MEVLFRAKELNSKTYVIGHYVPTLDGRHFIHANLEVDEFGAVCTKAWVEIDNTTKSISFEGMIDSEGNKIFASLSEDGKGGDLLLHKTLERLGVITTGTKTIFTSSGFYLGFISPIQRLNERNYKEYRVTGIQQ